jgi:hypothetical protein
MSGYNRTITEMMTSTIMVDSTDASTYTIQLQQIFLKPKLNQSNSHTYFHKTDIRKLQRLSYVLVLVSFLIPQ